MKKRSYSKENINEFKITPKVSSFKYTPTENAKSFIIHPQYEKYLKNSKPKPSVVQQSTLPVTPVTSVTSVTSVTPVTPVTPVTTSLIVKSPVMQPPVNISNNIKSSVLTLRPPTPSTSVSSEKKILKSGFKQNNINNNNLLKNNVKSFQMSSSVVFYSDINKKKYSKLVDTLFKIRNKKTKKKSNKKIVTLSEEEYKKACQEVERTQKELKQKQERLAIERQKQIEFELERQKQIELELEEQKQKQIELEKQRQLELEKQRKIELEKQKQLELEKQKKIKLEKQRQLELEKQRQLELKKQRQDELERLRQLELEKQRKIELEKQRQLELEKQRHLEYLEACKQQQLEIEKQRRLEIEKQKQIEQETQKRLEIENLRRIRLEKQRQLRLEKQRQLRIEKQRQLELEREKQLENERQKRIEFENKLELELEKQRQLELERKRQLELEKQRQLELELEKQKRLEQERQQKLKLEKQRQFEIEKRQLKEKLKVSSPPNIFSTYHTRRSESNKLKKNIEKNNSLIAKSVKQNEVSSKPVKTITLPKVTIIVPMYNVELYITNCALSLVNQSYSNIEILLVNDCSTDNTKKIADGLMEKYPDKIKVLHNPRNVGTYISINIGIVNSTGKYITIIGADDQFTPDKIARQAALLERNKKIVACYCQYERQHYKTKKVLVKDVGESTIMFKRAIINKIGYYDSVRFGADSEYRDRIKAVYGTPATSVIKRVMYLALFRPNSLTASGKSRNGSTLRVNYRQNYLAWHRRRRNLHVGFPMKKRPFPVPKELI